MKAKGIYRIPVGIGDSTDKNRRVLEIFFREDPPFVTRNHKRECEFAKWLDEYPINKGKGLYIWLLPRREGWRFLHVGISKNLSERTKTHFINAFPKDPVYEYAESDGDFGFVNKDDDHVIGRKDEKNIIDFLKKIRVMYLILPDDGDFESVKHLEGALARGADDAFRKHRIDNQITQITNDTSKVRKCESDLYRPACKELNDFLRVLPLD